MRETLDTTGPQTIPACHDSAQAKQLGAALDELGWIAVQARSLSNVSSMSQAPLGKLLKRLLLTRFLYWLSEQKRFSDRRRKRYRRSAEKRDPMLLSRQVDRFSNELLTRLHLNTALGEVRKELLQVLGLRVTAIVPNYNHARFLRKRLDSILKQSYPLIDLIILDDASTDDSRQIIEEYVSRYPDRIRALYNQENSGSVFAQWQKGHELADSDLVWFCESDDFAEIDFVERLISNFRDPSVMLAFGRIEFADSNGEYVPGLDHYREAAEPGIWDRTLVRPAATWFAGGFGVKNVIANVGGSLWRRCSIPQAVWDEARKYRIMGDWFLYSAITQGAQIAFEPSAVAYFRTHGENTSGKDAQSRPDYYKEYSRLMKALKRRWDIPDATVDRFVAQAKEVFRGAHVSEVQFEELVDSEELKRVPREIPHVLMAFLGFSFGGGEIFPIHLANALKDLGVSVSMLQLSSIEDDAPVRAMLDPAIPVYGANYVRDMGGQAFLRAAGVSIVHSHAAGVEKFLLDEEAVDIPYVSTLHGSYEATGVSREKAQVWAGQIDRFAYLADKNLTPFGAETVTSEKFIRFRNAMPIDRRPPRQSRLDLGISEDAVVFSLVARGIEGKGWSEAVKAFQALRERRPEVPTALILAGGGKAADAARSLAGADPNIHFLGYISEVQGLYRISDVALVPSRFPGESFPLCIIQAMQVGVPCIATDIGEIQTMIQPLSLKAGISIPLIENDTAFVAAVTDAMEQALDPKVREELAEGARNIGLTFRIETLAADYLRLYHDAIRHDGRQILT